MNATGEKTNATGEKINPTGEKTSPTGEIINLSNQLAENRHAKLLFASKILSKGEKNDFNGENTSSNQKKNRFHKGKNRFTLQKSLSQTKCMCIRPKDEFPKISATFPC
ncbi:MAG: hypothetical protein WB217_03575 [Mesobacillus sp.]|uniref:hypothetical protein n=1 Tax=Mesobacillus sp. TaxID=2675271 RepID=UPI003C5A12B1